MGWFAPATTLLDPLPPQTLAIRRGDRLPAFAGRVEDERGQAVSLVDARVFMTLRSLTANVTAPVEFERMELTIENAATGAVSYDWQSSETLAASVGEYEAVLEVEYADNTRVAVPSASCGLVVSVRPSCSSGWFVLDDNGALVLDDDEFLLVADVMTWEDGSYQLTEGGDYILLEDA